MGDLSKLPELTNKELLETYLAEIAVRIGEQVAGSPPSAGDLSRTALILRDDQACGVEEVDFGVVELFGSGLPYESAYSDIDTVEFATSHGLWRSQMWKNGPGRRAEVPIEFDLEPWRFLLGMRPRLDRGPTGGYDFLPDGIFCSPRRKKLATWVQVYNQSDIACHVELESLASWCAVEPLAMELGPKEARRVEVRLVLEALKDGRTGSRSGAVKVASNLSTLALTIKVDLQFGGISARLVTDRIELSGYPSAEKITLSLPLELYGEGDLHGMIIDPAHGLCHEFRLQPGTFSAPTKENVPITIPLSNAADRSNVLRRSSAWRIQIIFFKGPEVVAQFLTVGFPRRLRLDPPMVVLTATSSAESVVYLNGLGEGAEVELLTAPEGIAVEIKEDRTIVVRGRGRPAATCIELRDSVSGEELVLPVLILNSEAGWYS